MQDILLSQKSLFKCVSLTRSHTILSCFRKIFINVGYFAIAKILGGDNEIRTHDPLLARQVLSQLSYTPV
jgi:hypothetical protein